MEKWKEKKSILILGMLIGILLSLTFNACGDGAGEQGDMETGTNDSSYTDTAINYFDHPDSIFEVVGVDSNLLWIVNTSRKTMKRPKSSNPPALGKVVGGLNAQYPEIQLSQPVVRHDTLSLQILKSNYFTNQIGSTGVAQYLAQAIINLTSVPGINFVKLDFEEGSHASPGVWSKKDFSGYIIVQ